MSSSKCLINEMVRILIEKPTILISWVARIFWKVQLQGNPFYVDLFYFSNKVNHWLIDCWVLALQKINDHHNNKKQKFVHDSTFFFLYHHEVYKLHMVTRYNTNQEHKSLFPQRYVIKVLIGLIKWWVLNICIYLSFKVMVSIINLGGLEALWLVLDDDRQNVYN